MTEKEWLDCGDPDAMLRYLEGKAKASERKFRLFTCACCRAFHFQAMDKNGRHTIELAERFADGEATEDEIMAANALLHSRLGSVISSPNRKQQAIIWARMAAIDTTDSDAAEGAFRTTNTIYGMPNGESDRHAYLNKLLSAIREVFGNPFRLSPPKKGSKQPEARFSLWLTLTVKQTAQAIYNERAFDRLPILADALEDAGCDNSDILNHCRQPGEHVRGCWVVDLLLNKK